MFVGVLEDAFGGIAANQVGGDGDVLIEVKVTGTAVVLVDETPRDEAIVA